MPAWLTIIKTVLPHASRLAAMAVPAFTARQSADTAQQIEELQQVVRSNAEGVKTLAEELEKTVNALDAGGEEIRRTLAEYDERTRELKSAILKLRTIANVAVFVSIVAFLVSLVVLLRT